MHNWPESYDVSSQRTYRTIAKILISLENVSHKRLIDMFTICTEVVWIQPAIQLWSGSVTLIGNMHEEGIEKKKVGLRITSPKGWI